MPINSAQQVGDEFLSILLIVELCIAAKESDRAKLVSQDSQNILTATITQSQANSSDGKRAVESNVVRIETQERVEI